jgi:ADP-heptose:LPS heptosyltransferase
MLRSVESRGTGFTLTPANRIVIHPGAGKEANRWSAEGFLQIASRFKAEGKHVRILIGEAEIDRLSAELLKQFRDTLEVYEPQTLLDLLNEVASANIFIGNDSGPSHLAGIIGVPTLTLFGPSDPVRWRPLGPRVRIIHSQEIAEITSESVYTVARELLGG